LEAILSGKFSREQQEDLREKQIPKPGHLTKGIFQGVQKPRAVNYGGNFVKTRGLKPELL